MRMQYVVVAVALCGALGVSPEKALGEGGSTNCVITVGGSVSGASSVTNVCGISPEQVAASIRELRKGDKEQEHQDLQRLQQQLDLTYGQLRAVLVILGEKEVPLEQLPTRLVEKALQYHALETRLAELADSSELARKAGAALSDGDIAVGTTLLDQLITRQEAEVKRQQAALAKSYASRAQVFNLELNYQSSWDYYQKALLNQPNDPTLLNEAGLLAYEREHYEDAAPLFKRAIANSAPDGPDLAIRLNNLAGLYQKTQKYADAEPLYRQAIEIGEKTLGPDNPTQAVRLNNLGSLYRILRRYGDAEKLYLQAIAIGEMTLGPANPEQAARLNNIGELYLGWAHFDDAETPLMRAIKIYESISPDSTNLIDPLNNLGQLHWATRHYDKAEDLYKRAIAIGEKAPNGKRSDLAKTRINYAQLLDHLGRKEEAAKQRESAAPPPQ